MKHAPHDNAGFTLLEMLVAMVVLALAMTIVYTAFDSVAVTTDLAREELSTIRFQQYVWRNLNENLSSLYVDPALMGSDYALIGEDASGPGGPADVLSFCTMLPLSGAGGLPGVLRKVTYEAISPKDAGDNAAAAIHRLSIDLGESVPEPPMYLQIREEPLVLSQGDAIGTLFDQGPDEMLTRVQLVPIDSFDVEFMDGASAEWMPDWDSSAAGVMPWAIRVRINFPRTQEQLDALHQQGVDPIVEPDIDFTVPVAVGVGTGEAFLDHNHVRTVDFASRGDLFDKDGAGASGAASRNRASGLSR